MQNLIFFFFFAAVSVDLYVCTSHTVKLEREKCKKKGKKRCGLVEYTHSLFCDLQLFLLHLLALLSSSFMEGNSSYDEAMLLSAASV